MGNTQNTIPVENRSEYVNALKRASVEQDINAFSKQLAHLVNEGLKGKPVAPTKVK